MVVHVPPTPDEDEEVRVIVAAIDSYGNIAPDYKGKVKLSVPVKTKGLPQEYNFSAADKGVKIFKVRFLQPAVFVITAIDTLHSEINGTSNLIVTDGSFGPEKIFFGDIHTHSQLSDGRLPPKQKAQEVSLHRGCDFWALTDHCHDLTEKRIKRLNKVLEEFNIPSEFVTIPAYEWTSSMGQKPAKRKQYGHRNVYFTKNISRVFDAVEPAGDTPEKLKKVLEKEYGEVCIINHFHCGDPVFLPDVDDAVEVSGWAGDFCREFCGVENDIGGKYSLQQVFEKSIPIGVVAGSDHGTEAYYAGLPAELTGVYSNKLERSHIFDSIKKHKTFATTGTKTLL
ncbi:MAG: DUF3604 domain-containing protein, partial [Bacteroidetes bacterium]